MAEPKGNEQESPTVLSPLTCVAVVVKSGGGDGERRSRELVGSLPHAVAVMSSFLDRGCAPCWTIPRACEHNLLRLLPRLASREPKDMNVHYQRYLSGKGLVHAVRNENMEMVQWLCSAYCPSGFVWKGVEEAAAVGNIAILERLTQHRSYCYVDQIPSLFDLAAKNGHLETLKWIHNHVPDAEYNASFVMKAAIRSGDRELVKWVQAHSRKKRQCPFLQLAVESGNVPTAQFFFDLGDRFDSEDSFNSAAVSGSLEMVQWVSTHCESTAISSAVSTASFHGHLDIVQWLHANRTSDTWEGIAMDAAASQGHFELLQWLHANRSEGCSLKAFANAAENGHLDIVKWLHANRAGYFGHAGTRAAANGHLHVLVWLAENGYLELESLGMDHAAIHNHLDVVKWLHANRRESCTVWAMNGAAQNGHLEMVKWLHENRSEGCTTDAMDSAAANNHLDVVKWLHGNRSEGCTTDAMDAASSLEMVQWLHENRSEGCTANGMNTAAEKGDFELVLFLHTHRTEQVPTQAAMNAANAFQIEIFLWVCETYSDQVDIHTLADNFYFIRAAKGLLRHLGILKRARPQ
ncbi:Alpha- and gamma-adaptin-binding protein p34 [Globisporangium polare]